MEGSGSYEQREPITLMLPEDLVFQQRVRGLQRHPRIAASHSARDQFLFSYAKQVLEPDGVLLNLSADAMSG